MAGSSPLIALTEDTQSGISVPPSDSANLENTTSSSIDSVLLGEENFIRETDAGVFVDISDPELFDGKKIQEYITNLHLNAERLKEIDYPLLETLMYGNSHDIKLLKNTHPEGIKIAVGKDLSRLSLLETIYGGQLLFKDSRVPYSTNFVLGQDIKDITITWSLADLKKVEQIFGLGSSSKHDLSFDDFFVFLWSKNIRFGINYKELKEFFAQKKRSDIEVKTMLIASPKKPIDGTNDILKVNESLNSSKKRRVIRKDKVDHRLIEYTFPQAKKGETIFTIEEGNPGQLGRRVDGGNIDQKSVITTIVPSKENIVPGSNEKTKFVVAEGSHFMTLSSTNTFPKIITAKAKEDIFISSPEPEILTLSKQIVHEKAIGAGGSETSIEVVNEGTHFIQKGSIQSGYFLSGWQVSFSGEELAGEINTKGDIIIERGSIVGGSIISLQGNILIKKGVSVHGGSIIKAINGKVTIEGDAEKCTIIADEIQAGILRRSTAIGKKVTLHESIGNTIAGENIIVNHEKGDSDYVILIFYTILQYLKNLENKLATNVEKLAELQAELESIQTEWKRIKATDASTAAELLRTGGAKDKQIKDLKLSIEKDRAIQDKKKRANEAYILQQGPNLDILTVSPNYGGSITAYPVDFIYDNDFFASLNPGILQEARYTKKNDDLEALLNNLKRHFSDMCEKGIRIPVPLSGPIHVLYESIISRMGNELQASLKVSRMDTYRVVLLSREEGNLLFDGKSLGNRKTPLIPASINGQEKCFMADISERGSSFFVPNDMEIDTGLSVAVSYVLPGVDGKSQVGQTFRILRVEERGNYRKISGDYTDERVPKEIPLFLNYVAILTK